MARRQRSWRAVAALLAAAAGLAACVDFTAIDHERCEFRGFKAGTDEYQYCRDKLEQLRREEDERSLRFFDMLAG